MFRRKPMPGGTCLGRLLHNNKLHGNVYHRGPKALFSCGPPRSGKTASLVMLAMLQERGILVIDTRGDIFAATHDLRARMGPTRLFDPYGKVKKLGIDVDSDGWNPLATFGQDDMLPSRADAIAEAQVPLDNESQQFFPKAARSLLSASTMWECINKRETANVVGVRRMLTQVTSYDPDDKKKPIAGFLKSIHDMAGCSYAPIADSIGQIAERLDDTSSGNTAIRDVIGNAVAGTDFLKIPPLARDLQGPGFDFARLRGPEIVTVYVVVPAEELGGKAAIWLRMVINCALRDLNSDIRPGDNSLPPPRLVLDEFFAIGHLDMISNALAVGAGNFVSMHILLQDLNQLATLYPKNWRSFLNAAGAVTAFAPRNDWFTASELARLGGEKTEMVRAISRSQQGGTNISHTPHGFPLLRPEDLMRMPPGQMVCFVEPEPFPFFTVARPYVETEFSKRFNRNPYYR